MDDRRFDSLTRSLGAVLSRRVILPGLLAGLIPAITEGREKRRTKRRGFSAYGPCGNHGPVANRCARHRDCCTGVCDRNAGRKYGRCRCRHAGQRCRQTRNCCQRGRRLVCQNRRCRVPAGPDVPDTCSPSCAAAEFCNPETLTCCEGVAGPCAVAADCCLSNGNDQTTCVFGECNLCSGEGADCTFAGVCCSRMCEGGQCACVAVGGACSDVRQCCDYLSNATSCIETCCLNAFEDCENDDQCCSGSCCNGTCCEDGRQCSNGLFCSTP